MLFFYVIFSSVLFLLIDFLFFVSQFETHSLRELRERDSRTRARDPVSGRRLLPKRRSDCRFATIFCHSDDDGVIDNGRRDARVPDSQR
jgi:hypothetical protein